MNNSMRFTLIAFAVLLSVACGEWEVINDDESSKESDDFLQEEHFIPVDAVAKQNSKGAQRKLNSIHQDVKKVKQTELVPPANSHSAKNTDLNEGANPHRDDVVHMTSKDAPANQVGASEKSKPDSYRVDEQSDDEINLAEEGLLLVENKKLPSPSGRKLAQFIGPLPENVYRPVQQGTTATRKKIPDVKIMSQDGLRQNQNYIPNAANSKSRISSNAKSETSSNIGSHTPEDAFLPLEHKEKLHQKTKEDAFIGPVNVQKDHTRWDKGVQMLDETEMDIECLDMNSWECMMFKEDFLAMKRDRNLSGVSEDKKRTAEETEKAGNKRQKRQAPTTTTPPPECDPNLDCGSGDGTLDFEDENPDLPIVLESSSYYPAGPLTQDLLSQPFKDALMGNLRGQLIGIFEGIPGYKDVIVTDVNIVNGELKFDWKLLINPADRQFVGESPEFIIDTVTGDLASVNDTYKNNILIEGKRPLRPLELGRDDVEAAVDKTYNDPCATQPCSSNYDNCTVIEPGNMTASVLPSVRCPHKCELFESQRECEHGGICELDRDKNAFCSCTSNWQGDYCQTSRESSATTTSTLDSGEITGIVLGSMCVCAGILGCCCWCLCCCKRQRHMQYTHYSDEEGSGMFGSPSSKLSQFVIDRPHVSVQPIPIFNPTPPGSDRTSGSSSIPSSSSGRRSSFPSFRV